MAKSSSLPRRHPLFQALVEKRNAMSAVILRDMRTRFFNHGLGFAVVPLWPLVHMSILIILHSAAGRGAPPYGNSAPLFFATGLIPTLAFMYVSRFMGYSLIMNKPMLSFPVVKISDILTARAFLEIIAAFVTLAVMFWILWVTGQDPIPYNLESAAIAYLASLWLAFGMGYLVGVVCLFLPLAATIYQLILITLYISSGSMFVASNLPDSISYPLSYNPLLECVEWMRSAFYQSYSDKLVSPSYIFYFGLIGLLIGLVLDRFWGRRFMEKF
ncbi:MAG TPA: capsular biosynthesis protein [Rhizobium sp.]